MSEAYYFVVLRVPLCGRCFREQTVRFLSVRSVRIILSGTGRVTGVFSPCTKTARLAAVLARTLSKRYDTARVR